MKDDLPLEGIRVLDLTVAIAAPQAAMILSELGADVTKIESPALDPFRRISPGGFAAYNSGKASLVVDLTTESGRALVHAMVEKVDVLIAGYRPGVLGRMGLDYAQLADAHPRLIHATLTGFPAEESSAEGRRGTDQVIQAESGMMSLTGYPETGPTRIGFSPIDISAGHALAESVLAALIRRQRTGRGAEIALSLLEVAFHMQALPLAQYDRTGRLPDMLGNSSAYGAPANIFHTQTSPLIVSAYIETHCRALCRMLGLEDLLEDPRFNTAQLRTDNRVELEKYVDEVFATKPAEHWYPELLDAGILVGRVRSYDDLADDLVGHLAEVDSEDPAMAGTVILPALGGMGRAKSDARCAPVPGAGGQEALRDWDVPVELVQAAMASGSLMHRE